MPREPRSESIQLPDGVGARVLHWPGAADAGTALVIHHGLGEHAGRYQTLADGLPAALPIIAHDARGHGKTEGPRGAARGLDQLVDDFHAILPTLRERTGASKVVLLGHSMGAGAVGHYVTTRDVHDFVSGVWLSAVPAVVELDLTRYLQRGAARLLTGIVPDTTLPTNLPHDGISSVPAEIERYGSDPLIHGQASIALARSLFDDIPRLLDRGNRFTWPMLLWHGADDPIVDPRGTSALFEQVAATDKAMKLFEGARHEVHHESEATVTELMDWLRAWLVAHGAVAS